MATKTYYVLRRNGRRVLAESPKGRPLRLGRRQRRALELLPLGAAFRIEDYAYSGVQAPRNLDRYKPPPALAAALQRWPAAPTHALAALSQGADIDDDPHQLGWRARFHLDAGHVQRALVDLEALLRCPEQIALGPEPPGLLSLISGLDAESSQRIGEALAQRAQQLDMSDPHARRVVERLPPASWPFAYLSWRLRNGGDAARVTAAQREVRRRLEELEPEGSTSERSERAPAKAAGRAEGALESERPTKRARLEELLRCAAEEGQGGTGEAGPPKIRAHQIYRAARKEIAKERWPEGYPLHAYGRVPNLAGAQLQAMRKWLYELLDAVGRDIPPQRPWMPRHAELMEAANRAAAAAEEGALRISATDLLRELDARLLAGELLSLLELPRLGAVGKESNERLETASTWAVLHRGFDDKSRPKLWLLRVEVRRGQREFALIYELDGSWHGVFGDGDEVLNSVPERWFAEVVELLG